LPNLIFLAIGFLYKLGLALWLGGGVVLGAIGAPVLFQSLDSPAQAGRLFGGMLRRYSHLRLIVLPVTIAAAAAKYFIWETHAASTIYGAWIALRWTGLALMAVTLVYETASLHPALQRLRGQAPEGMAEDQRAAFQRLHGRAGTVLKIGLFGALLALLID
jgi:uncharacterized membrane protein